MDFPQYRKLSNDKVFYKIIDALHFEELKIMGTKIFFFEIKATQYPEKLKIMDMLKQNEYDLSNEQEWDELYSKK